MFTTRRRPKTGQTTTRHETQSWADYNKTCKARQTAFTTRRRHKDGQTIQQDMQSKADCVNHLEETQCWEDYNKTCKARQTAFTTWRRPNAGRITTRHEKQGRLYSRRIPNAGQTLAGHAKHDRQHSPTAGDPVTKELGTEGGPFHNQLQSD